ncbi:Na+/H+ antiporter, partial [Neisseria sp. P0021.S004]
MQLINYSNSILSIVPAAIALALAIATRRVLLSLGVGIIVGSFLLVGSNPLDALVHLKD